MAGRLKHELNLDPFARPSKEEDYGTRHPSRFEPKSATIESTQPQQRVRAHVHHSTTTQSITNNTFTDVVFDAVDFDTAGLLTANQFKIPSTGKITGAWQLHVHITWDAAAAGFREVDILQNGSTISSTHILGSNDQMSQDCLILVNDPNAGTLFKVQVKQTSGGNLNLVTEPEHSYFEIIHLW